MMSGYRWTGVAVAVLGCGCASAQVRVERNGPVAAIENARVRVELDLSTGLTSAFQMPGRVQRLRNARTVVDVWDTSRPEWRRTCSARAVHDRMGEGKALRMRCTAPGAPSVLLDLILYDDRGAITASAGIENGLARPVRLMELRPLTGGEAFPSTRKSDARTLDGNGGSGSTEVMRGTSRSSANNLLLTFNGGGGRHSLVVGGLTYHDFVKRVRTGAGVWTSAERQAQIAKAVPAGARLLDYVDCGGPERVLDHKGPVLTRSVGTPFAWGGAEGAAPEWFASVDFDEKAVQYDLTGLNPAKRYALGFSWWDFDANGRVESVTAAAGGRIWDLGVRRARLPAWKGKGQLPEEWLVPLPPDAASSGACRIGFANDAGTPNAVVSEVWLLELGGTIPASAVRHPAPGVQLDQAGPVRVDMSAADPVGRLVSPGETYLPDDRFYLDLTTSDPFEALEKYGHALRAAGGIRPNPYDFPTVCAWYVGIFGVPATGPMPEQSRYGIAATPGLVREMEQIAKSGFLNYARAAVRLVPDTYQADNEQGWWDDAHWARFGHYLPPYETSAKFGQAVRALGGLPFTYFQVAHESRDFRDTHADMMLGRDARRSTDYTNPAARAHMLQVYGNLRSASIAGMMFDYPDDGWPDIARGGLADPKATAASAYRAIFSLAKEGLGPDSWIHERILGSPLSDLTMGAADSQRVVGDTSAVDAGVVSRAGLRWYKNRVVFAYDMDAKDLRSGWKHLGPAVSDQDGRRMLLTMAYVAASRLLLATSFRDMSPEVLHDLSRTFPYPRAGPSARPVDAFVVAGPPRVYDLRVDDTWHEVALYNNASPAKALTVDVSISGSPADGGLGMSAARKYHVYDFWNDRYVGTIPGRGRLRQTLRPGEARVLSLHAAAHRPQVIATDRHVMQGVLDLVGHPAWNAARGALSGQSRVVAGEPYRVMIATNGRRLASASCEGGAAGLRALPGAPGVVELTIRSQRGGVVRWTVK